MLPSFILLKVKVLRLDPDPLFFLSQAASCLVFLMLIPSIECTTYTRTYKIYSELYINL